MTDPSGRLFVDRLEDELAVLLDDDGMSHVIARTLLPESTREGDVVQLDVTVSRPPTDSIAAARRALTRDDDGGDIVL